MEKCCPKPALQYKFECGHLVCSRCFMSKYSNSLIKLFDLFFNSPLDLGDYEGLRCPENCKTPFSPLIFSEYIKLDSNYSEFKSYGCCAISYLEFFLSGNQTNFDICQKCRSLEIDIGLFRYCSCDEEFKKRYAAAKRLFKQDEWNRPQRSKVKNKEGTSPLDTDEESSQLC